MPTITIEQVLEHATSDRPSVLRVFKALAQDGIGVFKANTYRGNMDDILKRLGRTKVPTSPTFTITWTEAAELYYTGGYDVPMTRAVVWKVFQTFQEAGKGTAIPGRGRAGKSRFEGPMKFQKELVEAVKKAIDQHLAALGDQHLAALGGQKAEEPEPEAEAEAEAEAEEVEEVEEVEEPEEPEEAEEAEEPEEAASKPKAVEPAKAKDTYLFDKGVRRPVELDPVRYEEMTAEQLATHLAWRLPASMPDEHTMKNFRETGALEAFVKMIQQAPRGALAVLWWTLTHPHRADGLASVVASLQAKG